MYDRDFGDDDVCAVEMCRSLILSLSLGQLILDPRTGLAQRAGSGYVYAAVVALGSRLIVE